MVKTQPLVSASFGQVLVFGPLMPSWALRTCFGTPIKPGSSTSAQVFLTATHGLILAPDSTMYLVSVVSVMFIF